MSLFVVVFFGAIVGFSLAVGLFLQLGLGYSPMRASLTMAAWAVGAFLGSGFGAAMMAKLGRRDPAPRAGPDGRRLSRASTWSSEPRAPTSAAGTWPRRWWSFGLGMGMIFVPLFDIIMGEVERPRGRLGLRRCWSRSSSSARRSAWRCWARSSSGWSASSWR